ncbi:tigger transposable element-derived protein 1-like [Toxorhynchites rutilus septentrionalis]|nr:tigger transposable element-derived protein 1-like [Toxorhynchites rutilus septentrionalis]
MEKALHMWIEDHAQKKIPLDQELIREKALSLYLWLEKNEPSSSKKKDFTASKGWFYNFIRSNSIRNVKIKGESASADVSAANSFPPKLAKIIKEGAYHGDQVFNGDETGLFWKRMPSRTYITQQEQYASGFKAAKDRVTLLFCSNASGDLMLKPLLINRAMTPRSLKGADFNKLPVHWKANTKAWVTKAVFEEWFYDMFIPEVKTYLEGKGLEFHVLLILDNAPGHLVIKHPNVQVVFLPPNTTSLLQPQDQGIIAAFKKLYIKQCLRYILEKLESDETMTVI